MNETKKLTAPEKIEAWVKREFNAKYVGRVTADLIDVASGNRDGNCFEKAAIKHVLGGKEIAKPLRETLRGILKD